MPKNGDPGPKLDVIFTKANARRVSIGQKKREHRRGRALPENRTGCRIRLEVERGRQGELAGVRDRALVRQLQERVGRDATGAIRAVVANLQVVVVEQVGDVQLE